MIFKQLQIFETDAKSVFKLENIINKFEAMLFKPCLPTLPISIGWTSPIDKDDAPFFHELNGCYLMTLQFEERLLPSVVIRQTLDEKVKHLEKIEDRKVGQKEKKMLKEEIIHTLLPRAFVKRSRLNAYVDTKNNWLVLDSANSPKSQLFTSFFKRTFDEIRIQPPKLKKISNVLTNWLRNEIPKSFAIEKNCVLQGSNQQKRIIRCQQQNLFAKSIQELISDGCEVKQLALNWQERLQFVMSEDFTLRNIQYEDELISNSSEYENETEEQRMNADFIMMIETHRLFLNDLLPCFKE